MKKQNKKISMQFIVEVDEGFDRKEKKDRDAIIAGLVKKGKQKRVRVLTAENNK